MYPDNLYFLPCTKGVCFPPILLELILLATVASLAGAVLWLRPKFLSETERRLARFSRRRVVSAVLLAGIAIGGRLVLLPWMPVPLPSVHDEFSYILQSDTFAKGRLTNPTHPMAPFFESFNLNQWPTYQSMYPPAQAVLLVIGQKVFASVWFGLVLTNALLAVSILWMLYGWMPPQWAFLGAAFVTLRYCLFTSMVNSYWRAPIVALGAALVFGGLARLRRGPDPVNAAIFALGLMILANGRPYEGFVISIVPCCYLLYWLIKREWPSRKKWMRAIIPASTVIVLLGAASLYYNWRGTGHALRMPYQENWQQYHISKPFFFQKPREIPHYNHDEMRRFYVFWEYSGALNWTNPDGIRAMINEKLSVNHVFYIFPLLLLFVIGWWDAMKSERMRPIALSMVALFLGLMLTGWHMQLHYAMPGLPIAVALILFGYRIVRTWRPLGRRYGAAFTRVLALVVVLMCGYKLVYTTLWPTNWSPIVQLDPQVVRASIESRLKAMPGQHVVIVHHQQMHAIYEEWVFNSADIDAQKVIWARDMGMPRNDKLANYYQGHNLWVVDPDEPGGTILHKYGDVRTHLGGRGIVSPIDPAGVGR